MNELECPSKDSHKEGTEMENQHPKANINVLQKNTMNGHSKNPVPPRRYCLTTANIYSDAKAAAIMLMTVQDPDFYDFDKDRTENSFGENQIWAACDNDDGMPCFCALIHGEILGSHSRCRSWGFEDRQVSMTRNTLSDRGKWTKGAKGSIQIFSRKEECWALYGNWSPDWNELTPDEVIHKYDMVEVLEDYNREQAAIIAPLVKVDGFKSAFHQHLYAKIKLADSKRGDFFDSLFKSLRACLLVKKLKMFSRVAGSSTLQAAAMPLELHPVIIEAKEVETVEDVGEAKKLGRLDSDGKAKEELLRVENASTNKDKWDSGDDNNADPEAVTVMARKKLGLLFSSNHQF
ncbi:unnamed protein product [Ilex paraguariensis]|uniref:DUF3444 domain-containing protein n=1 Tax=Ilex paraguariensis TaxID=185542 RepID=A0ABC8UQX4_9AQUA